MNQGGGQIRCDSCSMIVSDIIAAERKGWDWHTQQHPTTRHYCAKRECQEAGQQCLANDHAPRENG